MRKQAFAGIFRILVKQIHLFIRIAFSKYGNVNAVFLVSVPEQIPVRSDVGHASLMNQYIIRTDKVFVACHNLFAGRIQRNLHFSRLFGKWQEKCIFEALSSLFCFVCAQPFMEQ